MAAVYDVNSAGQLTGMWRNSLERSAKLLRTFAMIFFCLSSHTAQRSFAIRSDLWLVAYVSLCRRSSLQPVDDFRRSSPLPPRFSSSLTFREVNHSRYALIPPSSSAHSLPPYRTLAYPSTARFLRSRSPSHKVHQLFTVPQRYEFGRVHRFTLSHVIRTLGYQRRSRTRYGSGSAYPRRCRPLPSSKRQFSFHTIHDSSTSWSSKQAIRGLQREKIKVVNKIQPGWELYTSCWVDYEDEEEESEEEEPDDDDSDEE